MNRSDRHRLDDWFLRAGYQTTKSALTSQICGCSNAIAAVSSVFVGLVMSTKFTAAKESDDYCIEHGFL